MTDTYHGRPCKKCGGTERHVSSRACIYRARSDHLTADKLQDERNRHNKRYADDVRYREAMKVRVRKSFLRNRDAILSKSSLRYKENYDFYKDYRARHYIENRSSILAKNKEWREKNKWRATALVAKRRAEKTLRTPKWADMSAISAIYSARPDGYHVDHIIPLQGKTVCGLHVEYNLQYLPAVENIKKSNKFIHI